MTSKSQTPVIIGVGDVVNRSKRLEDALEPLELMLKAIEAAWEDTGLTGDVSTRLKSEIDSVDVVQTWTWPYTNLPDLLANRLGAKPRHTHYSDHGGNQPAQLFDHAARRISLGQSKVALVTGGEALASCIYYQIQSGITGVVLRRSLI